MGNIKDFIQGNSIYFTYKLYSKSIPKHVREQALYRAYLCQPCLLLGKCKICKCKTPNMFFSPYKIDKEGKWGKMLSSEEWELFKKNNPEIDIPDDLSSIVKPLDKDENK